MISSADTSSFEPRQRWRSEARALDGLLQVLLRSCVRSFVSTIASPSMSGFLRLTASLIYLSLVSWRDCATPVTAAVHQQSADEMLASL